jgi:hypothetical protein
MSKIRRIFARASFVALLVSAVAAASAAAATPVWEFSGSELKGTETAVGAAFESGLTMSGLTTTCQHFLYNMKIYNSGGAGKGEITELPLYECHTSAPVCTVESISAEKFPWSVSLKEVASKPYIVIEGVRVNILYGGELCALDGTLVPLKGSAGGLIENSKQTATFNKASFEATKTKLEVGGKAVEWNGVFPTEAFEWNREKALEAS